MSGKTFTAQVDDIIRNVEARMTALVRSSVNDVIEDAQTPVAKGGNMRVDTGFLRNSGMPSLNGMPSGPSRPESKVPGSYTYSDYAARLVIANYQLGQTIYYGWTANYAKYRNAYDGFLDNAVQKWPQIVERRANELKQRIVS